MLWSEADTVAIEHMRWARTNGMSLKAVAESIGREWVSSMGPDDVIDMLSLAWIGVQQPLARKPRQKAKRVA